MGAALTVNKLETGRKVFLQPRQKGKIHMGSGMKGEIAIRYVPVLLAWDIEEKVNIMGSEILPEK